MSRTVQWEASGARCVYAQQVGMAEIQAAIAEINADPRIHAATYVLHDFRVITSMEEGVSAMLALVGHLYGRLPYNLQAKTAVLVNDASELARFNSLASSSKRPMRAFHRLEEAQAWIAGD